MLGSASWGLFVCLLVLICFRGHFFHLLVCFFVCLCQFIVKILTRVVSAKRLDWAWGLLARSTCKMLYLDGLVARSLHSKEVVGQKPQ